MTTTNGTRPILDLKLWQYCSPAPVVAATAMLIASSRHFQQQQLYVTSATSAYLYKPAEDGWIAVPSPALGGTFGAGACGVAVAVGPTGAATAGTTSTITTSLNLQRDLRGYSIHITAGPQAGATLVIASNTIGTNAVITLAVPQAVAFSGSTTFRLLTPRWYVLNAVAASGTTTANLFKFYDFALNTWTAAETGATDGVAPAAVIGSDGRLISTPSWIDTDYVLFAPAVAATSGSAAGAFTIANTGRNWAVNQWANAYQVRIVSGAGAGQVRTIASNTATVLTVATAWAVTTDNTSVYVIEGCDDYIYYTGSGGTAVFRYSISAGTWTSMAVRTAPGAGVSGHWVYGVSAAEWNVENTILNGRYIYSFRGAGGQFLDRYDIPSNTWTNGLAYAPAVETFTTGTKYVYHDDFLYVQKEATGRWFKFDIARSAMDGWNTMQMTQGAAVVGDTAFDVIYKDGAAEIQWVYMLLNTSNVMLRCMVI